MSELQFSPGPLAAAEVVLVTGACQPEHITAYVDGLAAGIQSSGRQVAVGSPYGASLLRFANRCDPDDLAGCEADILLVDAGTFLIPGMTFAGMIPNLDYTRALFLTRVPASPVFPGLHTEQQKRVVRTLQAELAPYFDCPVNVVDASPVIDVINLARTGVEMYDSERQGVGSWML